MTALFIMDLAFVVMCFKNVCVAHTATCCVRLLRLLPRFVNQMPSFAK